MQATSRISFDGLSTSLKIYQSKDKKCLNSCSAMTCSVERLSLNVDLAAWRDSPRPEQNAAIDEAILPILHVVHPELFFSNEQRQSCLGRDGLQQLLGGA